MVRAFKSNTCTRVLCVSVYVCVCCVDREAAVRDIQDVCNGVSGEC